MNEVRLDKDRQNIVIANAVRIMKERTVGKLQALQIDHVDQEFLALRKEDVGKKFPKIRKADEKDERRRKAELGPEELGVISVSRAIEEAVRELMASERPDILKPSISRGSMLMLGAEVIGFLSDKNTEKFKLPSRIAASVQENMIRMEEDVSALESLVQEKMVAHEGSTDESEKSTLAREINDSLMRIGELNGKIRDISDKYDFSSLTEKPEGIDDDDEESDSDTGGIGILDRDDGVGEDILCFEENITLSASELHLRGYLPETIKKSEALFDDSFFWWAEGEEWQRSNFHIRDFPEKHQEMLEKILHRKRIIAFYAKFTLGREEKKRAQERKFGGPGLGKIRKYLPELEGEIQDILGKINSISLSIGNEGREPSVTSEPTKIQDNLEEMLDYLYQRYETTLCTYTQSPSSEQAKLSVDIRKICEEIIKTHRDLSHHCKKHNLESQHLAQVSEGEESGDNDMAYLSVDEYLESPDFFEVFPNVLTTEKSDAEKNLLVLCNMDIADELLPAVLEGNKVEIIYREDDGSESTNIQKMRILEEVLHIVLRRKMIIYFEGLQQTKGRPNEESSHHLSVLQNEIQYMHGCITMLSNRIDWSGESDNIGADLENEMHYLSQRRFHLFHAFMDAQDGISRQIIGSKILQLCLALEKRRDALFDTGEKIDVPDTHIEVTGLSYSESRLLRYVFSDIREGESEIFAKNMPFLVHSGKSGRENKLDMEKSQTSQLSERKMIIYFFAMKRIDEIDIELCSSEDNDAEKLVTERDEIERHTAELREEIKPLLQRLQAMNESAIPRQEAQKKLHYQDLYNEAMKVLGSLDGAIANTEGEHVKMIRNYWEKIQRQVLRFSDRIKIEESKGNFHKIPALQEEFDTEMVQIINDIKQYLTKILERQGHKGNEPDILTEAIHHIREKLFGRDQKN